MAPHQRIITLVMAVIALSLPSTATILTVKPNSTTPCADNLCFTLSEYVQNHTEYFNTSNITLQFLPGTHTLDFNLTVANIHHLNIFGNDTSPTRVECAGSSIGFQFRNISEVRVSNMMFTSCGRVHTVYVPSIYDHSQFIPIASRVSYAVRFESIQYVKVIECVFHNNAGTALGIFNSSAVLSGNNVFSSNCRRCTDVYECYTSGCLGGGVYVEASDANFNGNATFDGNLALDGGGIYVQRNSNVSFSGSTTFKRNSAWLHGGGMWACFNSDISFSGSTTFEENSATLSGGGIYTCNSDMTFSGSTNFKENSASNFNGGGIVALFSSFMCFSGSTVFEGNSARHGGGIYAWSNSDVSFNGSMTFERNSATEKGGGICAQMNSDVSLSGTGAISENTAEYGGGIMLQNNNIAISGNITIRNNRAQQRGGGMFLDNSIIDISGNSVVEVNFATLYGREIYTSMTNLTLAGINNFTNNSAREGGGLYATANSKVNFHGMSTFTTNKATGNGGGIYMSITNLTFGGINKFTDNSAREGGGIYAAANSNLDFDGISTFNTNKAIDNGGGIYTSKTNLTLAGTNEFTNNSAAYGSGINALDSSNVSFSGNTTFQRNSAEEDGGGIFAEDNSDVNFSGACTINDNIAEQGGGIYLESSIIDISGNITVRNNTALQHGGWMYMITSNLTLAGINKFTNNSAREGGGIHAGANSNLHFDGMNTFGTNKAIDNGGGIYISMTHLTLAGINKFLDNSAREGGGIHAKANSNLNFDGMNIFDMNKAIDYGGGIYLSKTNLMFGGISKFAKNSARGGGVHFAANSNLDSGIFSDTNKAATDSGGWIYMNKTNLTLTGINKFTGNLAREGGGIYAVGSSNLHFNGMNTFDMNKATDSGGGIYISKTHLTFAGMNTFIDNSAREGGGIYAKASSTLKFDGINTFDTNRADISGGGIWMDHGNLMLNGSNSILRCTARFEGGGISIYNVKVNLPGNNKFIFNLARSGGGISAHWSRFSFTNSSYFSTNSAENIGGGISTSFSTLEFGGNNTFHNNCADIGGGIHMLTSSLNFVGNNYFNLNHAKRDGGGIYGRNNGTIDLSGYNSFQDNKAERGAGMFMESCNLTAWRNNCSTNCSSKWSVPTNIFERNAATNIGGGVCIINSMLHLSGSNRYQDNEAKMGGGMFAESCWLCLSGSSLFHSNKGMTGGGLYSLSSDLKFSGTNNFTANHAINSGGGFATVYSTVDLAGNLTFVKNVALTGGAMYTEDTQVNMNSTTYFIKDSAHHEGGAMHIRGGKMNISGKSVLKHNSAAMRGGSLFAVCTTVNFTGITIIYNSTSPEGAAIHVVSSSIIFEGITQFQNNLAHYGGAVFSENSNFTFGKSTCARKQWGAEFCHDTTLLEFELQPGSSFENNTALRGGAIHLDHRSSIHIHSFAYILFKSNKATEYGGAIYVIDISGPNTCPPVLDLPSRNECFVHVVSSTIERIELTFEDNTAEQSGSVLYGGMLNKCNYTSSAGNDALYLFTSSIKDEPNATEVAAISSDPVLCFCTDGESYEYECKNEDFINAFPGQQVRVSVIAVDQTNTPIVTAINSNLISDKKYNSRVCEAFSQEREGLCTNRSYAITSPNMNTTSELQLYPTTASGSSTSAVLNIAFQNCPIGFELSSFSNECICDRRLQMFTNTCNIDSQTLLRTGEMNFWVNASYNNEGFEGYIVHPQCPLNYCTKRRKHINLNNPDEQCRPNRRGLLCSSCKDGFSLILGSSQCKKCSNRYLALFIPFALAGVALVILLFILNMTVTTGTLHGLIFYANIVAANYQIFFPPEFNIVAKIFIAWLNLDLGIETCFFHGMDAYSKLWLQFVFPLYIWVIVGFLIYISRQSQRVTQFLGSNPVAVLDTLFLLSYTKLLRTIITTLSLTTLSYPNNNGSVVWLYDPSISALKLVPFISIAVVFLVFLLLPYTLLLLLGQWLWTENACCLLAPWNKYPRLKLRLKTILDPYHAPYKSECRYWTGLFLLFRCFLFLVSAFNISGDKNSANLLVILIIVGASFVVFGLSGRVYKSWCLNALELSFLLNLCVFSAGTYHVNLTRGDQAVIAYISVGIAFLTFVGIVAYHAYLRIKTWKPQYICCCSKNDKISDKNTNSEINLAQNHQLQTQSSAPPSTTVIDTFVIFAIHFPPDLITN